MYSSRLVYVLLIEDSDRDAELIEETISQSASGFVFHRVETEDELVRALAERSFDLALSDHKLPVLNSTRALEVIRQSNQSDLPFIIVSGSIGEEAAVAIMRAGASDYVSKDCLSRLVPAIDREMQKAALRRDKRIADERLRESNEKLRIAVETLTETQNYLASLEKYRALGQIATGVAHDFNNSLTKALGITELLMERYPQEKETLDELRAVTQESAVTVERLLRFGKKSYSKEAPPDPVDLKAVIEQTIKLTKPRWKTAAEMSGHSISVETSLAAIPLVVGNATEFREVFMNLIFNACDALPNGGKITISTRCAGDFVVAEVKDTGIGMTEEVLNRCLEPFFTTRGESASGLGLCMTDSVIKRYGGSLEIVSNQGKGTTVTIYLNRHLAAEDVWSSPKTKKLADIKPCHVLVVDDDPTVARLLKAFLELDGHRVTVATDGPEALYLFAPEEHNIVITDRAMPSMSGIELSKALKEINPQLPIIMSSGLAENVDESERSLYFDVHMPKPVSRASLQQAISATLIS